MRVLKEDLRKPQGSPKDAPMDYFNYERQIAPTTLSFKRASGTPVKMNRFQGKFSVGTGFFLVVGSRSGVYFSQVVFGFGSATRTNK